ncbi:methylmalonyl Co-A mutase-associated GTPase MeaB [Candidatus Nitrospira inopinata]|jgi:LAO/AO transport system kinase|uniref:LAO/AO transport system ATPase n=1 Tax=Candidatus Nitrospira inopinata TaxID=1715989 RepID=A0A0S4KRF4_9BACT|nr:methylmalonyl Co-A mutase-associated GTPase MeaB [Candidatus Nitrospira inopinata]CUQ65913.1 LAO/AO transport system ATPase [Candidatus Nitrospira inopinata]
MTRLDIHLDKRDRQVDLASTLAERVRQGEVRAVARLITSLERREQEGRDTLRLLQGQGESSRAAIIGVTGYPGAGKSTIIDQLVTAYRRLGHRVGVLAVDMTSPFTGGALLGDRIRMQQHALDAGVFIRSLATRGHHGGLASVTGEAVSVLEAAGYDVILVETVGVGQGELEIATVAPTVVAVVAPGLGDEVQAMKAGLLEVAQIIVVNRGDHPEADRTLRELREWYRTVLKITATTGQGIPELIAAIAEQQRLRDLEAAPTRAAP